MTPKVISVDPDLEYSTEERCAILELSNDGDDPDVSIARARVAPGITTAWHQLIAVAERYVILEGEGIVEIGDLEAVSVSAGSVVRIPPETRQRIRNTGAADLIFLAICSPRFTPDCYVSLETESTT